MRYQAIITIALILCLGFCGAASAQTYNAERTDIGRPLKAEREVTITPVVPSVVAQPVAAVETTQQAGMPVTMGANNSPQSMAQQKSFWDTTKETTASASKATWSGIKKGSAWTWKGLCKGSFYLKEGCISVAEKTGMVKDSELNAHQDIVNLANKTLVESETKREIREDQLARSKVLVSK